MDVSCFEIALTLFISPHVDFQRNCEVKCETTTSYYILQKKTSPKNNNNNEKQRRVPSSHNFIFLLPRVPIVVINQSIKDIFRYFAF